MTKEQWYLRLRSWTPEWFRQDKKKSRALLYGMARILESVEADRQFLLDQTFIDESEDPYLDMMGNERNVDRQTGEQNAFYRPRIKAKSTKSNINRPALEAIILSFIAQDLWRFTEDYEGTLFCDREYFCDRGDILIDPIDDAFSVIVDSDVEASVVNSIIATLNREKAFGVLYRFIQRYAGIHTLSTEDGDTLTTEDGDDLLLG